MKANELRVLNWVIVEANIYPEPTYLEVQISAKNIYDFELNPYLFQPIQLTEEWLKKFGFVKYDQMGDNSFWNYSLSNNRNWNIAIFSDGVYVSFASLNWDNCPVIKYAHQLQNLYFAITGQELEIIS